ncbi:MAG: hypothetical protein K0S11_96, partial [Gammaproteobacteria bacterium]|nr:hypothetical protein [Gammaproteobacteria bacterium]
MLFSHPASKNVTNGTEDFLKTKLKLALQALVNQGITNDYYMDKILLPVIDKVDLNSEEGKKRVLEYLYGRKSIEYFSGSKKLQINDNLVYTVKDCRKSTIHYHT